MDSLPTAPSDELNLSVPVRSVRLRTLWRRKAAAPTPQTTPIRNLLNRQHQRIHKSDKVIKFNQSNRAVGGTAAPAMQYKPNGDRLQTNKMEGGGRGRGKSFPLFLLLLLFLFVELFDSD